MWVVTVFNKNDVRIFEFQTKAEASKALNEYQGSAILSFTY